MARYAAFKVEGLSFRFVSFRLDAYSNVQQICIPMGALWILFSCLLLVLVMDSVIKNVRRMDPLGRKGLPKVT